MGVPISFQAPLKTAPLVLSASALFAGAGLGEACKAESE